MALKNSTWQEKLAASKAQAQQQADGPPAFVPAEEREKEEEKRVAELQMKGKMMMNYGWPKAVRAGVDPYSSGATAAIER